MAAYRQGPPPGGNTTLAGPRGYLKAGNKNVGSAFGAVRSGLLDEAASGATRTPATQAQPAAATTREQMVAPTAPAEIQKYNPAAMPGKPLDDASYSEAGAVSADEGSGQWGSKISISGEPQVIRSGGIEAVGPMLNVEVFKKPFGAARRAFGRQ